MSPNNGRKHAGGRKENRSHRWVAAAIDPLPLSCWRGWRRHRPQATRGGWAGQWWKLWRLQSLGLGSQSLLTTEVQAGRRTRRHHHIRIVKVPHGDLVLHNRLKTIASGVKSHYLGLAILLSLGNGGARVGVGARTTLDVGAFLWW